MENVTPTFSYTEKIGKKEIITFSYFEKKNLYYL